VKTVLFLSDKDRWDWLIALNRTDQCLLLTERPTEVSLMFWECETNTAFSLDDSAELYLIGGIRDWHFELETESGGVSIVLGIHKSVLRSCDCPENG
jgi:hypothetical protein